MTSIYLNPYSIPYSNWYSVLQFGATGDGVTDDTTAIQTAITRAANNGGGIIYFPRGTYAVTGLTVSAANITLVGTGLRSTIIKKSASTASTQAILITADYCGVKNLTIQGVTSAAYVVDENGITIRGTSSAVQINGINIDTVEVYNVGRAGIDVFYASNVLVNNCRTHNCGYIGIGFWSSKYCDATWNEVHTITPGTASNAYGIVYSYKQAGDTQASYGKAEHNYIHDISLWEALDTHGWTHVQFANNTIYQCKRGIIIGIDALNNFVPSYCSASNNTMDAGSLGTILEGIILAGIDGGAHAIGGAISDNVIKTYTGYNTSFGAITVYSTTGCAITGNSLYNSYGCGINLYKDNTDVLVVGNTVAGIVTGLANASGIASRSTGNTGLLLGNVIDATAEYGIYAPFDSTGIRMGNNPITTSGTTYSHPANLGIGREIYGSGTVDPGNCVDGTALAPLTITVTGAQLGDAVEFSAPYDLQGLTVTAYVSATNTVAFKIWNKTGGAIDLASGTWRVRVTKL